MWVSLKNTTSLSYKKILKFSSRKFKKLKMFLLIFALLPGLQVASATLVLIREKLQCSVPVPVKAKKSERNVLNSSYEPSLLTGFFFRGD